MFGQKQVPVDTFWGRVAVVTGASRDIGRATAQALAREGCAVVCLARSVDQLDSLVAEIEGLGGRAWAVPADVTDEAAVRSVLDAVRDRYGRIDILILNAGIGCQDRLIDLRPEDLRRTFDVNFFGPVACLQAALPDMIERRSGHIVFVSSIAGKRAFPVIGGYSASKWALQAVAETLRHEVWRTGIRASIICPGPVQTGFDRSVVGSARRPGRFRPFTLTGDEVANVIVGAIARNRREVVVSWPYRVALLALSFLHPHISPLLWLILDRRPRTGPARPAPPPTPAAIPSRE
ncbi:MAG TPA: SDR family NAD(P)-dependent oxidoreductase [Dehalococcoidia bacterium]|nr:SDR family NAD(P)-dependent oxidoreductase [Dehalococcoidia bacterium]